MDIEDECEIRTFAVNGNVKSLKITDLTLNITVATDKLEKIKIKENHSTRIENCSNLQSLKLRESSVSIDEISMQNVVIYDNYESCILEENSDSEFFPKLKNIELEEM